MLRDIQSPSAFNTDGVTCVRPPGAHNLFFYLPTPLTDNHRMLSLSSVYLTYNKTHLVRASQEALSLICQSFMNPGRMQYSL
mmetsp:Transcript_25680/g.47923  ORF Transcript_25680/g.47923 Transcript_25680/m.47923 type:complete len:82 (-) Transcript_25680:198-443(-)